MIESSAIHRAILRPDFNLTSQRIRIDNSNNEHAQPSELPSFITIVGEGLGDGEGLGRDWEMAWGLGR